ncbi:hypothetical protein TC41_2330 [Alicyclobacillus acidocaldarius subsp. acidocaldarius Tc-4-1]|uniref:Uncharacterized protein n=1 Tax=Alicyclobacillus acidocaldarius (strain Tc-4-1) TaxID=1048834 RepID=F8IG78_ALIAT|nr:hypothetical protein TC41_2330 [Alicyclobacillus acidocaldarius subsp. acidocaldarius Tc-4-1]
MNHLDLRHVPQNEVRRTFTSFQTWSTSHRRLSFFVQIAIFGGGRAMATALYTSSC